MRIIEVTNIITFPLLISSGVLGYLTLYILNKTGKVNTNEVKESMSILTFISFVNFLVMWLAYLGLSLISILEVQLSLIISLFITLILSSISAFLIPQSWIDNLDRRFNDQREYSGKAKQSSKNVRQHFYDRNEMMLVYIFDFNNKPISRGYSKWTNEKNDDPFEMILIPFSEPPEISDYFEIVEYIEREDVNSEIFLSFDKNIKIYYIIQ